MTTGDPSHINGLIRCRCYNCDLETDMKSMIKHTKESKHYFYFHLNEMDYLREALKAISHDFKKDVYPIDERTIDYFTNRHPIQEADQEIDALDRLGGNDKIIDEICKAIESVYDKFKDHKVVYPKIEPLEIKS